MARKKQQFFSQLFLKIILNLWTILVFLVATIDFFGQNKYHSSVGVVSAIYIAILGFYAANKEIDRWTEKFSSKFLGEAYVGIWTALIVILIIIGLTNESYHLSTEITTAYISVLGIFAITQKSKNIHLSKKTKK